jgi:magnesium transporter
VVDANGRLIGQITIDDVVDVIEEQAEHAVLSMAGLDEDDDMFAPVITSARRRAVWLGINLATAFLASAVVAQFEATLGKVVVLAVLMPVVASMGGIAGSQTLTLMIRGLALGRVEDSNARWLMFKEAAVGLLNGIAWAVVVGAVTVAFFSTWAVGVIIAAAVTLNLVVAALAGFAIPLVMRRLRIDPALAGSVVLTTVTDVVGFVTFLGLGALFLT